MLLPICLDYINRRSSSLYEPDHFPNSLPPLPTAMSMCLLQATPPRLLLQLSIRRHLSVHRSLHAGLLEAALAHGDRTALVDSTGRHSYRELVRRAARLADRLREAAPEPGARVGLLTPPGHQYVAAQWAVWMAGHVGEMGGWFLAPWVKEGYCRTLFLSTEH